MKDAAPVVVGYAIGLVFGAIRFLVMFVVGGAIVLGFARALVLLADSDRRLISWRDGLSRALRC